MDATQKMLDDRRDAEAVRDLHRATILMRSGQADLARLYMAQSALGYRNLARIERSYPHELRAIAADVLAERAEKALIAAGGLGTPQTVRDAALEAITPLPLDKMPADYVGPWIIVHRRSVPNPHCGGIDEGLFIGVSKIPSGEFYVEIEIHLPDATRTQENSNTSFKTVEEALLFAGRMAALGEALIAIEIKAYHDIHAPAPALAAKGQLSLLGVVS